VQSASTRDDDVFGCCQSAMMRFHDATGRLVTQPGRCQWLPGDGRCRQRRLRGRDQREFDLLSGQMASIPLCANNSCPELPLSRTQVTTTGERSSLGVEDAAVLARHVGAATDLAAGLAAYSANRIPRYQRASQLSEDVADYRSADEYARRYVAFSEWMVNSGEGGCWDR
jgi:hypothetical protein